MCSTYFSTILLENVVKNVVIHFFDVQPQVLMVKFKKYYTNVIHTKKTAELNKWRERPGQSKV